MNETHRFFALEYCCDNNFDIWNGVIGILEVVKVVIVMFLS